VVASRTSGAGPAGGKAYLEVGLHMVSRSRLLLSLLLVPALQQSTPTGGAIAKFVPPVPTPASFISDQRAVLTPAQRQSLDARITRVQQAGLGDIAVAVLPSIGSYSPNQVAVEIYRTWKVGSVAPIGSARRNVGVLLLIVPKELAPDGKGQCWVNTGTGSEGIITDAIAGRICRDDVIPHLRNKDYNGAIGAGITAIEARMRTDAGLAAEPVRPQPVRPQVTEADDDGNAKWPLALGIGGILTLFLGAFVGRRYARNRVRGCPRCKQPMRRLGEIADNEMLDHGAHVEEQLGSVDYDVWVCECGGKRVIPYKRMFTKYKKCRKCHRLTASGKRVTIKRATTASAGKAEDRYLCKACDETWVEYITLPQIVEATASSSSGSSSGFSGGGGGGGSSFGGSGSTAGGGGGSSY
jgi:uncharacterized protein